MRPPRFGSRENQIEPYIQTICVPGGRHLLRGGRRLLGARPARPSTAGEPLDFRQHPRMGHVAGPVSHACVVCHPGSGARTSQTVCGLSAATGHIVGGLVVLGVAEVLKLLLIERLFSISRDKLMSIPAFAWGYGKFQQARDWVYSLSAWQLARRIALIAKRSIRRYVLEFKTSRKRVSWQPR